VNSILPKTPWVGLLIGLAGPAAAVDRGVPADYPTIQAAVDASVSGDTIHIAPGVYLEQVTTRGKDLTLAGSPGTILRAFPNMADLGFGYRNIVLAHQGTVVLRGLSFEGDQLADEQPEGYDTRGVYIVDAAGVVEDCTFTGFRVPGTDDELVREALAIAVFNDLSGAPLRTFRMTRSTIVDSQGGLLIIGDPGNTSLDVTIEDSVIRGVGPTQSYRNNLLFAGLTIKRGVEATVSGNTICGFSNLGGGANYPVHFGVFVYGGSSPNFVPVGKMRFEGNLFQDNQVDMELLLANQHEVLNNRFERAAPGARPFGLFITGEDILVQGNEFRDMPAGILVKGDDPEVGLLGGVATGAVLKDNRFCEVATPVIVQDQASATETGTLTCPWPVPEVTIDPSVILSWPAYYDGWVLECSDDMEDWLPAEAMAPTRRDGLMRVPVPADHARKFFRLVDPAGP